MKYLKGLIQTMTVELNVIKKNQTKPESNSVGIQFDENKEVRAGKFFMSELIARYYGRPCWTLAQPIPGGR